MAQIGIDARYLLGLGVRMDPAHVRLGDARDGDGGGDAGDGGQHEHEADHHSLPRAQQRKGGRGGKSTYGEVDGSDGVEDDEDIGIGEALETEVQARGEEEDQSVKVEEEGRPDACMSEHTLYFQER
jgi:hypothetical protein